MTHRSAGHAVGAAAPAVDPWGNGHPAPVENCRAIHGSPACAHQHPLIGDRTAGKRRVTTRRPAELLRPTAVGAEMACCRRASRPSHPRRCRLGSVRSSTPRATTRHRRSAHPPAPKSSRSDVRLAAGLDAAAAQIGQWGHEVGDSLLWSTRRTEPNQRGRSRHAPDRRSPVMECAVAQPAEREVR